MQCDLGTAAAAAAAVAAAAEAEAMEMQPKRKMKTPTQLERLEQVYTDDKYPSEVVRSQLSQQLNLTDRQVKMWFCHRRLKDRKVNTTTTTMNINEEPPPPPLAPPKKATPPPGLSLDLSPPGSSIAMKPQHLTLQMQQPLPPPPPPLSFVMQPQPQQLLHHERFHHPMRQLGKRQRSGDELVAAVRMVEEQLGEPLREDAPTLAYEFDPPPPGAFGTPIDRPWIPHHLQHQYAGSSDGGLYSDHHHARHGNRVADYSSSPATSLGKRKMAAGSPSSLPHSPRVPHEHQFIPEHPTGGNQFYDRRPPPPPLDVLPSPKLVSLAPFLPGPPEFVTPGGGNRTSALGLVFSPGEVRTSMFPGSEFAALPRFPPPEVPLLPPPPLRPPMSEKAIQGTERLIMLHEQEQARMEKKRKAEEARFAKELEAQEKRMRREAERQEAMRRKKEDQERRELEKLNREKQKELERLMRERAREEERIQRQHKKEYERMEKMMQKEHLRVEKLRQKEEMRREKEATKLRAAYERATAKKLAKLSTGLMDDEQLELMQMGAFVQGLVSASGFDSSKVELSKFPPSAVRMKLPLSVAPWIGSHHNVSNLFMVWRMLTTFADVLGLWPFTLDEFVQALHDYDSRLLAEIHLALLKTLVKDVEDASEAAASGGNQASTIASGGHPEVVEASYSWGFDIQDWGRHLNPLTWPEILRQYALASGFGPKWRKTTPDPSPEGRNAEDTVANLRSGAAAANAATQMRGRNLTRVKKPPKMILTPGTVKYAAFHVLSVAGSKGLTTIEAVDRIQNSGLRDLTSSKTPEASVSAVLSRNSKLFERVAPSTYCLRSIYRKDNEVAEEVLAAAREKLLNSRDNANAVDEEAEEVEEREEEEDGEEQQDVEDREVAEASSSVQLQEQQQVKLQPALNEQQGCEQTTRAAGLDVNVSNAAAEAEESSGDEMEIDESQAGEVWVQGLTEGEYTDLSVEERLSGLVALVETVNQGNTIRSALEERHDAAASLRRQLWEEVQLDKRRLKEELCKSENADSEVRVLENGTSCEHEDESMAAKKQGSNKAMQLDKSRAQMKTDIRLRAEKLYVIRSLPLGQDRRFNRYWQFITCHGGADPGCGRIYFESHTDGHWEVIDTEEAFNALINSLDTRGEREAQLFTALKESEDMIRQAMQARLKQSACGEHSDGSPGSGVVSCPELAEQPGSLKVDLGLHEGEKQRALERYSDMEAWLWSQCQNRDCLRALRFGRRRCSSESLLECEVWPLEHTQKCQNLVKDPKTMPTKLQLIKQLLSVLELSLPREALRDDVWTPITRTSWCNRLKCTSSLGEVFLLLLELEGSVHEHWLSSSYETIGSRKRIPPWIPQTSAALAFRLAMFDNAVAYSVEQMMERKEKQHKASTAQGRSSVVAAAGKSAAACQEPAVLDQRSQLELQSNGNRQGEAKTEDSDDSFHFNWADAEARQSHERHSSDVPHEDDFSDDEEQQTHQQSFEDTEEEEDAAGYDEDTDVDEES